MKMHIYIYIYIHTIIISSIISITSRAFWGSNGCAPGCTSDRGQSGCDSHTHAPCPKQIYTFPAVPICYTKVFYKLSWTWASV